ncbi:class I SAM-dependent methyltransferase [Algoriphagus sp. AGSA1]|uniref:class I SAM-dependent methyltransferase n=1 Tax=Algoriphagus sp. AGSA1 TaxID=2907213 RepID=UPI001F2F96DF|nr:class I SAM-dependent methyltransferase [Algoriphagus sp. AGSA1]
MTLGLPITYLSTLWLRYISSGQRLQSNEKIFSELGLLPVLDHYYQPLTNPRKHLKKSLREDRNLKGIDWNIQQQLEILNQFHFSEELKKFPLEKRKDTEYYYNNTMYASGDSEYLYSMVRLVKPTKIIEIGSGNSTLMVINAIKKNKVEHPEYQCKHICVEPYEQPWLEKVDVELKRTKVEEIDLSFFTTLEENDILFIDSSHVIRPQGDVLFEILEVLPILNPGVFIHIHDIFSPKDYLDEWIYEDKKLWNEQYLLEAFLSFNPNFEITGAVNYLSHNHRQLLAEKCPVFNSQPGREPGAFWIRRI